MNSSELKGFLTGLIMGDGYIDKGITKRAFRLKTINEDFADFIFKNISENTNFNICKKYYKARIDKNNVNHKENWEIYIKAHPYFNKKYNNFYDDYRNRIVTKNAINWLNPIGLANWYMSDGYICLVGITKGIIKSRRLDICTDRYTKENIEDICRSLKNKFDLNFSIVKRDKYYRIRLRQMDYCKFINIIKPYVVPSMTHKLYLGYEKQPIWMDDNDWQFQNSISAIALTQKSVG